MSDDRVLAKKSDITFFGDIVRSKKGITTSLSLEQVKEGVAELKGDSDEWQGDYTETGDKLNFPSGELVIESNGSYDVTDKVTVNVNVAVTGGEETGYTLQIDLLDRSGYNQNVSQSNYSGIVQYQINEDGIWHDFASIPLTLTDVKTIRFKCWSESQYCALIIGFGTNVLITQNCYTLMQGQYGDVGYMPFKLVANSVISIGANNITTGGGASD